MTNVGYTNPGHNRSNWFKTGSDSSPANCSATGVNVTGPQRLLFKQMPSWCCTFKNLTVLCQWAWVNLQKFTFKRDWNFFSRETKNKMHTNGTNKTIWYLFKIKKVRERCNYLFFWDLITQCNVSKTYTHVSVLV